jgi:peptidyl-prolyl cis-trans isomerase C
MKRISCVLRTLIGSLLLAAIAIAPAAVAQNGGLNEVLVENAYAKVTRADYEAELLRLPPETRGGFANNPKRVYELLTRLLLTKSLAAEARKEGLDKNPDVQAKMALEIDRLHAGLLVAKIEEDAGRAFDSRKAQTEARAREMYLVHQDQYRTPEQVSVSHILFDTKKHTPEEALKLATETRAKIVAGADFDALAKDLSEDPSALRNGGHLDYFDKAQMDPAFSDAAFALRKVGDLSAPVHSSFGYHLIRLDGRHPATVRSFDQVKESILTSERAKFVYEQREAQLGVIKNDPSTKVNDAAITALTPVVDPDKLNRAMGQAPK